MATSRRSVMRLKARLSRILTNRTAILIGGGYGPGKSTFAKAMAARFKEITRVEPRILGTDKFGGEDKLTVADDATRESRYQLLATAMHEHWAANPESPLVIEGEYDPALLEKALKDLDEKGPDRPLIVHAALPTKRIRAQVEGALRSVKIAPHRYALQAPADSVVQRLEQAEEKGADRDGSVLTARMIREKPERFRVEPYSDQYRVIENSRLDLPGLKTLAVREADQILERVSTPVPTATLVRRKFQEIDAQKTTPEKKLQAVVQWLRRLGHYDREGTVSALVLSCNPHNPSEYSQLRFVYAEDPDQPHGIGKGAFQELEEKQVWLHKKSKTAEAHRGGNPTRVLMYQPAETDMTVHRRLSDSLMAEGQYFPVGKPEQLALERRAPLMNVPRHSAGHISLYRVHHGTAASFMLTASILHEGRRFLDRWLSDALVNRDKSVRPLLRLTQDIAVQEKKLGAGELNHSQRTALIAVEIARHMRQKGRSFEPHELEQLAAAARLNQAGILFTKENRQKAVADGPEAQKLTIRVLEALAGHSGHHPVLRGVLEVPRRFGLPGLIIRDLEGNEKPVLDGGQFWNFTGEQWADLIRGRKTFATTMQENLMHGYSDDDLVQGLLNERADRGSLSLEDVHGLGSGLYDLVERKPAPSERHVFARIIHLAKMVDRLATGTQSGLFLKAVGAPMRYSMQRIREKVKALAKSDQVDPAAAEAFNRLSNHRIQRIFIDAPHAVGGAALLLKKREETV